MTAWLCLWFAIGRVTSAILVRLAGLLGAAGQARGSSAAWPGWRSIAPRGTFKREQTFPHELQEIGHPQYDNTQTIRTHP
jgi:hypothetical protein